MARAAAKEAGKGRLIGYARVSTTDQDTDAQIAALKQAGCVRIFQDTASGGDRERPQLARALESLGAGDTLIVARLDRLARSLSHLLEVTEGLRAKGAFFRSLADPFDTSSAQGLLMMQMLGAFAEFERALCRMPRSARSGRATSASPPRSSTASAGSRRQSALPSSRSGSAAICANGADILLQRPTS